jgi:hypothetical protein
VERNDQRIRELIEKFPPELHVSENYTPLFGESALEIIRRYIIFCTTQGHLLTLHRPYTDKSVFSKTAATKAAWALTKYQSHILSLADVLEPYIWFIEEFSIHTFFVQPQY